MTVRWGMLSTSSIGRVVAGALAGSEEAQLVAVAGRDGDAARRYAAELGIGRSHGSYDALLTDPDVDAVYVPLPIALHTEWTLRALRAGKHVLCEKPLATSAADARACVEAAEVAGVRCVEGFMWRHHPQTTAVRRLVDEGAIGRLAFVRAALTVDAPAGDIRRTGALGGGAVLDLGCYCVSAIRLFAGEPRRVTAARVVDDAPGADDGDLRLAATLEMPGDVLAQFDVALDFPRRDELELVGTDGTIVVPDPWLCRPGWFTHVRGGESRRVEVDPEGAPGLSAEADNDDAYRIEFEHVSRLIATGGPQEFGRDDAIAQATALEAVRRAAETDAWVEVSAGGGR